MKPEMGWHFIREDGKLGHNDGCKVRAGELLKYRGKEPIALCQAGMHASRNILDALQFAPGPVICRVELRGEIVRGDDKSVATERYCHWMLTPEQSGMVLCHFARWCALRVIHQWKAPDVVVQWLLTGDESLWAAARAAARVAQSRYLVRCATLVHDGKPLPKLRMPKDAK